MLNQERSALLLGSEKLEKLAAKNILIFGLGGVGGQCFEALVRHGIKRFTIVDFDVVNSSNLNRQILYTASDISRLKVDAAKARALKINSEIEIKIMSEKYNQETEFDFSSYDFVIDAIDDLRAKVLIINQAINKRIPFVTSLAMGNRLDPSKIIVSTLDKTTGDPLAKKLRTELRKLNIELKVVPCVFSLETPIRKEMPVGSTYLCPNTGGILLASFVIKNL